MSSKYSSFGRRIETEVNSPTVRSVNETLNFRKNGNNNLDRPKSGVLHSSNSDSSTELKRDIFGSLISLNDPSNETN